MKTVSSHLLRTFVTGALAALPLAATVFVFWWAVSLLWRWLGPGSAVGSVLSGVGLGVSGSEFVGYLMGLGIVALGILLLGVLIERAIGRSMARLVDRLLRRIPLVRTVWDLAQRMVGLLQQNPPGGVEGGARSLTPVWCHFGGLGGAAVLALQSSSEPVNVAGRPCLAVLVPTAPVPIGGGLLFVPQEWVSPADVGAEALTSIYVSMGVTAAQHLPQPAPPPPGLR
ncbi:MAG: DUF502 domain-containing protein [Betaproteobacteria bacterium]